MPRLCQHRFVHAMCRRVHPSYFMCPGARTSVTCCRRATLSRLLSSSAIRAICGVLCTIRYQVYSPPLIPILFGTHLRPGLSSCVDYVSRYAPSFIYVSLLVSVAHRVVRTYFDASWDAIRTQRTPPIQHSIPRMYRACGLLRIPSTLVRSQFATFLDTSYTRIHILFRLSLLVGSTEIRISLRPED